MTYFRDHHAAALHPLDYDDALDLAPARLVAPASWEGHIPFAFWLAKALQPRVFVELGTYSGNSYFAFCQGLARFAPAARAYAVDSWEGDDHAGFYGDTVFAEVDRFNRAHFARFSTLMRARFDDARGYFAAGEIDLLHIDGLHSYEAVRHDFETWRDALSPRAIVLFHDTNVRERDFGVWRLWRELRETAPSFEFTHSNGLGVLGLGPEPPEMVRRLFELGDGDEAAIRAVFARRGETFERQLHDEAQRREDEGILRQQIDALRERLDEASRQLETAQGEMQNLTGQLGWYRALIEERTALIAAKDELVRIFENLAAARGAALATRDAILLARDTQIAGLLADLRHQAERYDAQIAAHLAESAARVGLPLGIPDGETATEAQAVAALKAQLDATVSAYVNSTSWKITRPLRAAVRLARTGRLRGEAPPMIAPPAEEIAPPAVADSPEAPAAPPLKAAMRSLLAARLQAFLSGSDKLRLPRAEAPEVSILLVLYNQAELTFGCLGSILETVGGGGLSAEVVIVDNASTDLTGQLLDRIEGATILRNPSNLHFLKGVNLGARAARGANLLLLNNDAQLLPGAVASALRTLHSAPDIGAVGGRIILPDGVLQEAGSIIWRDGACSGYGRGADPANPDFMFQRDVDFCSGAFLLTPLPLFQAMGGFDERFAPAYYEETDYCVRLWEHGWRVVYDPDATIIHYEFGSASSEAALAMQAENHKIFASQHAPWLAGQFDASPANVFAARSARSCQPRVLVLEDRVPKPELGAGYPRANRLLHELVAAGAQVTFFPMYRYPEDWASVRRALDPRIEVLILGEGSQIRAYLEARRGHFDAIIVCRPPNMAVLAEAVGADRALIGEARLIYDAEALFVSRELQKRAAQGDLVADAERHRLMADEVALTRLADAVISVSRAEQRMLEDYGAKQVYLLGHALDDEPLASGFDERDEIVFLGALPDDHTPNADAVRWFAAEILPEIRRSLGEALRLTVIGRAEAPAIQALDGDALTLRGMVDALPPALSRARIMVVPSRLGAGIPHKVHQAAMLGIPMVVSELIFAQLGWSRDADVLVASDPQAFAAACVRLFTDRALWETLRANALARARADCAPEKFTATLRTILRDIPITSRRAPAPRERAPAAPARPLETYVGRPEGADYAIALPFEYPPSPPAPRVGVMCHLFHPETAPEILRYLRHLPAADLLLTTDTEDKRAALQAAFGGWESGTVEVALTPNRGRDIGPKLIAWAERYGDYDLVLHLHSKVSRHADFLSGWRSFLLENLAGSREIVASIYEAFDRLPDLGMLASQHYEPIRRWIGWNGNFETAQRLAGRLGFTLSARRALDFPSGSMFWARPAALKPLLDLRLAFEDFPEEGDQVDETPAHAIERLYFYVCEAAGFSWLKAGQRALFWDASRLLPIRTPEALSRFMGEHGVMLSGPGEIAVRGEPPPLLTRVPPGLAQRLNPRKL